MKYVVGTHLKRIAEALLMSTHNMCSPAEIRKYQYILHVLWVLLRKRCFSYFSKKICCGYSLEAPQRGASNEYHNIFFRAEISKHSHTFFTETKKRLIWS